MKKQIISLIILALLTLVANADTVEIDGIYYNLLNKFKTAEVTSNPNKYSGSIVIPETVEYNGVQYSVTSIGISAFHNCSDLTIVTIPNSVTSIGASAFYECRSLTSVTIPNSVTSIGESAFYRCQELTNITIPNSVTSIEGGAFEFCIGLTSVTIPNSLASIGKWVFAGCVGLTSVAIPNSVTSIGISAFRGCSGLTNVTIPNSVTSIGSSAFYGCTGITSITIPNSVTNLGGFGGCTSLTSIAIPNSVTNIGESAFYRCTSLTSITIPNSVTSIGESAFSGCTRLTSITIPNSVTSIENSAFSGCNSLASITILGSSLRIGSQAFSSCPELNDVYCHILNPLETYSDLVWGHTYNCIESNVLENSYIEYATLHVPASAYGLYKTTEPWSNFKEIVTIEGTTPEIEKCKAPTIAYKDGKLTFSCETEGVEYMYDVKLNGATSGKGNEIQLSPSVTVGVYATKAGYYNSDVATKTIDLLSLSGDVSGDGKVDATDLTKLIDILLKRQ